MSSLKRHIPLVLVLAVAACLRLHDLTGLPAAHYRDVALTATDALRAASGHPRLHFTYDEGLYADLMGLVFALFGASDFTVRLPGAIFGVLTCWGVFRLGRALGFERAGLHGAALLALSFWSVLLSRSGFRAVLLPCLLAHATAFFAEGLRGRGTWRLVLGGALFGLGIHVYPAVRFAPLFLPAWVAVEARSAPGGRSAALRKSALFAAAAFLVALPMLAHYLRHPEDFNFPHRVVSVLSPRFDGRDVPGMLAHNLGATLLMFHAHGDDNNRHNLAGAPMLDPLSGLLFLAGAVIVVFRRPSSAATLLFGWLVAMLLPSVLSVQGVPHALRSCGVLPAVALLGGIGLEGACRRLRRHVPEGAAGAAILAVLLSIGCFTAWRYFHVWGRDPQVARDHDVAYRDAARALLAAPVGTGIFLVANGEGLPAYGHPVEAQVYLFEMRDRPPVVLGPRDSARLVLQGKKAMIALIRRDDRVIDLLRRLNPGATIVEVEGPDRDSPVFRVD